MTFLEILQDSYRRLGFAASPASDVVLFRVRQTASSVAAWAVGVMFFEMASRANPLQVIRRIIARVVIFVVDVHAALMWRRKSARWARFRTAAQVCHLPRTIAPALLANIVSLPRRVAGANEAADALHAAQVPTAVGRIRLLQRAQDAFLPKMVGQGREVNRRIKVSADFLRAKASAIQTNRCFKNAWRYDALGH
jgi:hypothetical protein